ncbi:terminase small subunit [Soonwooa sp.]|uniref:terminase small subunit n=1 Tax=Soonwooa sp. TaxID=1938592 RepID=UPI0026373983|nr:terminase small subunit [Soonwooa sp.]
MNHKRKIFISEYSRSGNATEAAKKAGYSDRSAYSTGQRLLKNAEIVKEISKIQNEALENAEMSVIEVVNLVKGIATSGKSETVRLRAMDMLLKYLGAYNDDMKLILKMNDIEIGKLADKVIDKLNNGNDE